MIIILGYLVVSPYSLLGHWGLNCLTVSVRHQTNMVDLTKWQRSILKSLMKIFPKVQFIVTTHSPSVIASAISSQLIILDEDGCHYPGNSYGKDSNSILSEIMDVAPRPDDIQKRLNEFYQYLDEEKFEQAEKLLDDLVEYVGEDNSDVISARVALDFETS